MPTPIRHTFSLISPFSYLGARQFFDMAEKANSQITYRPVSVGDVFAATGGLHPAKRHPSRQAYRMVELTRWKELRGKVNMNLKPPHFPANDSYATALVNAVLAESGDPRALILGLHNLVWEDEGDIADEAQVEAVGAREGYDMVRLTAAAKTDEIAGLRAVYTQEAIDAGIFGLPWYQVGSDDYWGQDYLEIIAQRLGVA